jgi:glycosyltransferase involved in cell wall biosynthesis
VENYWQNANLHVMTSSMECNSTVIFEAMEHCVPTITTGICGMADIVKDETGIKIPVNSWEECVQGFAEKIDYLAENRNELLKMALNLRKDSFNYVKEKRVDFYKGIYDEVLAEFHGGEKK